MDLRNRGDVIRLEWLGNNEREEMGRDEKKVNKREERGEDEKVEGLATFYTAGICAPNFRIHKDTVRKK